MTSSGVVTAGAMLFFEDTSYICVCVCVCVTLLEGREIRLVVKVCGLVVGATWSSRVTLSDVCCVVETRFV